MPIGAMLSRRDHWMKGMEYATCKTFALHTSTFGGGSLACAAGLAAVRAFGTTTCRNAEDAAPTVRRSKILCLEHDFLCEVRGRGLLLGLEFNPTPTSWSPMPCPVDATGASHVTGPITRKSHSIPACTDAESAAKPMASTRRLPGPPACAPHPASLTITEERSTSSDRPRHHLPEIRFAHIV